MLLVYSRNWWTLALRGLLAVLFGILTFVWPGITLLSLVFLFGAYAITDGILAIAAGVRGREQNRWWLLLIHGIFGVIAGVLTFVWPGITALLLLGLIAGWALFTGVMEIVAAIQMRKHIRGEWLLALSGAMSVLFGVLLLLNPAAGALAVVWIIGAYAIFFGVLLLALGFKLRGLERTAHPEMSPRHA
ncbi:MAG: HdeD family acid-resistance protein [Vicinamibacterales bacterium]